MRFMAKTEELGVTLSSRLSRRADAKWVAFLLALVLCSASSLARAESFRLGDDTFAITFDVGDASYCHRRGNGETTGDACGLERNSSALEERLLVDGFAEDPIGIGVRVIGRPLSAEELFSPSFDPFLDIDDNHLISATTVERREPAVVRGIPLVEIESSSNIASKGQYWNRTLIVGGRESVVMVTAWFAKPDTAFVDAMFAGAKRSIEVEPTAFYGANFTAPDDELAAECDAGNHAACGILAFHLSSRGRSAREDLARSRLLAEPSCASGNYFGCAALEYLDFVRAVGTEPGTAEHHEWYGTAIESTSRVCDGEVVARLLPRDRSTTAAACLRAGVLAVGHLAGEFSDVSRGAQWLRAGCDLGLAEACEQLAMLTINGRLTPPDYPGAVSVLLPMCREGVPGTCRVGWAFLGRPGVEMDVERGKELLRRGCDLGDEQACVDLRHVRAYQRNRAIASVADFVPALGLLVAGGLTVTLFVRRRRRSNAD